VRSTYTTVNVPYYAVQQAVLSQTDRLIDILETATQRIARHGATFDLITSRHEYGNQSVMGSRIQDQAQTEEEFSQRKDFKIIL